MKEIDFLPLTLGQTAWRRHRHLRTIIVAAIAAAIAGGVHAVHQLQARSAQAGAVRPETPRSTGTSNDNLDSGVQSKHHVRAAVPLDRGLQGTPHDAVLTEFRGPENRTARRAWQAK